MKRALSIVGLGLFTAAAACSSSEGPVANEPEPSLGQEQAPLASGALVDMSMNSTVGVLLDEIPEGMRDAVVAKLLAKPASFWTDRAQRQIQLMTYRLVFREYFYKSRSARRALPLPPAEKRNVALSGAAKRVRTGKHDTVQIDYTFQGTLLTDAASPGVSEPRLGTVGGTWDEPFTLPVDPELVFQRTRYACMDEEDFPPNSVDSEEVDSFFDATCTDEKTLSRFGQCHQTESPGRSCKQAVEDAIGRVDTKLHFTRLAYSAAVAEKARVDRRRKDKKGAFIEGADMQVVDREFRENRIIYRYIEPNACEVQEKCVTGTGWRRLLQFSTTDENIGTRTLDIGAVDYYLSGGQTLNDKYHIFEYSSCHQHYHFTHYGSFTLGDSTAQTTNAKRGFCLQATDRFSNHEQSPLHNPYGGCDFQGVDVGWVDQYKAGLPCQWIDVTDVDTTATTVTKPLSFHSNPDGFLCEGTPVLDANGNPVFEPTAFKTDNGETVYRPKCNFVSDWDKTNLHSYDVTLSKSGEGLITTPCTRGQIGPLKNCGFTKGAPQVACTAGAAVKLHCTAAAGAQTQVVRVCERSETLRTGIPCKYEDALATALVPAEGVDVSVNCPAARGGGEPGGAVSLYTSTVTDDGVPAAVTCTQL